MEANNEFLEIMRKVENHEKRIGELENILKKTNLKKTVSQEEVKELDKLIKKTGINKSKLDEVYDVESDQLTVVKTIGEDSKEKIKNIVLLVLLGYKYLLGIDNVLSQEIRRSVSENGLPCDNFGTYINEMSPSLIRRKGKMRSPRTLYRLLPLGETRARETLSKTCGA